MLYSLQQRWRRPGGYREVLTLAVPLIITTGSNGLQTFVDRLLLSWYSPAALAAVVPASMVCITLTALFIGLSSYVGVMVAQHYGARRWPQVGQVVWQSIYLVVIAAFIVWPLIFVMAPLFQWINHEPALQLMEVAYAQRLIVALPMIMLFITLTGFFTGIGRVGLVMWLNFLITLLNIGLDSLLIFGYWGFPAMGVSGAAWATVCAYSIGALLAFWLFLRPRNQARFHTRSQWRWNGAVLNTLVYFGLPVGIHMQMEMLAWTVFVLLVGSLGIVEMTAHSIAMNIFMLVTMPMVGISVAVSVLVGKRLGEGNVAIARVATVSALQMAAVLFFVVVLLMTLYPEPLIGLFTGSMDSQFREQITPLLFDLMVMVALFCWFDALLVILAGALKGAGDTHFVAWAGIALLWGLLIVPTALWLRVAEGDLRVFWGFVVVSGVGLCVLYGVRYHRSQWQHCAAARPVVTYPLLPETVG